MAVGPQFFISYDKTYRDAVVRLHRRLEDELQGRFGRDIRVFLDNRDIEPGTEWLAEINEALASVLVLVVLVNDAFVMREYCRHEFAVVKSRREKGERCAVITVRFQADSEIYRKSQKPASVAASDDVLYLESLKPEERQAVIDLRAIQYLDGTALREFDPDAKPYKDELDELVTATAQSYRDLSRHKTVRDPPPASPSKAPRLWIWGYAAALIAAIAVGTYALLPSPAIEPAKPPPPKALAWRSTTITVLTNRSSTIANAYREGSQGPDLDTVLDRILPATDRPEAEIPGAIHQACIAREVWYKYPGPLAYAMVAAKSLGMRSDCSDQ